MGLFKRLRKTGRGSAQEEGSSAAEAAQSWQGDCSVVADCQERHRSRLCGTVKEVRVSPDSAQFAALLEDSSGEINLIWTGRLQVPGVVPGATLLVEGTVARDAEGELSIRDPQFSIRATS